MEKLGFQYDDRQMKEIFNTFDTDGSQTLDYREFVKMVLG
jgi:Ca2+-binding EF-hand superfamily protein